MDTILEKWLECIEKNDSPNDFGVSAENAILKEIAEEFKELVEKAEENVDGDYESVTSKAVAKYIKGVNENDPNKKDELIQEAKDLATNATQLKPKQPAYEVIARQLKDICEKKPSQE